MLPSAVGWIKFWPSCCRVLPCPDAQRRVSREVGHAFLPAVSAGHYCPYPKLDLDASAASHPSQASTMPSMQPHFVQLSSAILLAPWPLECAVLLVPLCSVQFSSVLQSFKVQSSTDLLRSVQFFHVNSVRSDICRTHPRSYHTSTHTHGIDHV